jgi:PKD repeat protein
MCKEGGNKYMNAVKLLALIISAIVIAGIGTVLLTKTPTSDTPVSVYKTVLGTITLGTNLPESPENVTLFRVILRDGDMIRIRSNQTAKIRQSVISEADAPAAALAILANYGGLPNDAEFNSAETSYAIQYDTSTSQVIAKYPVLTEVQYDQRLNGMSIAGAGGVIIIDLGENGELLELRKVWRTVIPSGAVRVISASTAFEKLKQADVINPSKGDNDLNITRIRLGYYEKGYNQTQEYLDPIWIFRGSLPDNTNMTFYVYARQFANFTATPTSGKVPLTVTFADISDASPVKWLWDFGDGTNSTAQNPAHTYTSAGTYNVSLKAWNDLGSDTMERPFYITVRNLAPPVANFTARPTTGSAPLSVMFNDTSVNLPTSWLWTFGDGSNATMQNPVHIYIAPGNYTVSLNVTNEDGPNSITKPDYIIVSNLPPTTLTTIPTTTHPTPRPTKEPLSPLTALAGIGLAGVLYIIRRINAP